MVSVFTNFWLSFLAGVFASLGAVCVLPLYPGFLVYLSNKLTGNENKKTIVLLGFVVMSGIILSMLIIGLIFTLFLQTSLTNVIGVISPIAFIILGLVSLLLIFNYDLTKLLPQLHAPVFQNVYVSALVFGLFFGAIVLPCNPASLIVLFAVSTTTANFLTNFINFILFGLGMALPLLIFAIISAQWSKQVIGFLGKYKRWVNLIAGIIMLIISFYYLIFVFKIFG